MSNKNKSDPSAGIGSGDIKYIVKIAGTLLIICACMAFMLAAVNSITADKIEQNNQNDINAAIQQIFPSASSSKPITGEFDSSVSTVYEVKQGDSVIGHCVSLGSSGFGGSINMMVGIDTNGTVAGIKIITHSETPGLGSRVDNAEYLAKYTGKSGTLVIKQDIDAISGATVSSKAVLNGVNTALSAVSGINTEGGGEQ